MAETPACFRLTDAGLVLFVRLTPKASRDALEGLGETDDGRSHMKARVRAVPENGKANTALEKLVAKGFGIPASAVSVVSGATARLKTVELKGDPTALHEALKRLLA